MPYYMMQKLRAGKLGAYSRAVYVTVDRWLRTPGFFYAIVGLLVLQSVWIALTARYPQAFDENYHLGLIRLHAGQWLPFFAQHIPGAEVYGAISRDPSYLYHYIFSIPYRLLDVITDSQAVQVIVLRLMNIGLFVGGLFVYRKVLAELGASLRLMHVVMLFFVLTPIMPLLAGQINYDNFIFLLTGLLFLYTVRYMKRLRRDRVIDVRLLLLIGLYGLLASVVKYTSTPVFMAVVAILGFYSFRAYRGRLSFTAIWDWPKKPVAVGLGLALVVLSGLALERYGVNLVRYHTPVPDCADVLTIEQCKSYSPWVRDYLYAESYPKPSAWGIFVYPGVWAHRMVFETMFTITSRFYPDGTVEYVPAPPLTVANYTAWTLVTVGSVLALYYMRRLWSMTYLRILLLAIAFYTLVLFLKNFSMYLHTGEAMAIHGRYLISVFPVLYMALALCFGWLFEHLGKPKAKIWLAVITLLFFIHGAGITVWLLRGDSSWDWQQSAPAQSFNGAVRSALDYVIIK